MEFIVITTFVAAGILLTSILIEWIKSILNKHNSEL